MGDGRWEMDRFEGRNAFGARWMKIASVSIPGFTKFCGFTNARNR
jgi:hypothetical protein